MEVKIHNSCRLTVQGLSEARQSQKQDNNDYILWGKMVQLITEQRLGDLFSVDLWE